jgi:hypothetical protein
VGPQRREVVGIEVEQDPLMVGIAWTVGALEHDLGVSAAEFRPGTAAAVLRFLLETESEMAIERDRLVDVHDSYERDEPFDVLPWLVHAGHRLVFCVGDGEGVWGFRS